MRVLLDTCVLYPPSVRDFLLGLAVEDAFEVRISAGVLDELEDVLVRRPGLRPKAAETRVSAITAAGEQLGALHPSRRRDDAIGRGIDLPDVADAHLVDAALASDSDAILTFNLSDLPEDRLGQVGLEAWHPDLVLEERARQRHPGIVRVAGDLLSRVPIYERPADIALTLSKAGLPQTARHLLTASFASAVQTYCAGVDATAGGP